MKIELDDLSSPAVHALLGEHLRHMFALSLPESVHALDIEELRKPDLTFWSAWDGETLLGCGALKELGPRHGEIKSMRTASAHRGQGVGGAILAHILAEAKRRSYERLSLETGAVAAFAPSRRLYERFGFTCCPAFADYVEDPNSVFMTRGL